MILNALDEVLFWEDIPVLKDFIHQNMSKYYPHDPEQFHLEKAMFLKNHIPNKETFISKLVHYSKSGTATWVSGRSGLSDDMDSNSMVKAIKYSSQIENGRKKALQASRWQKSNPDFWNFYSSNVLHSISNHILELTVGAGGGTNVVMSNMCECDYYMGVDIDFVCAKNADALAKYYEVNGLGIATTLWNLPFDNEMFTSVCTNAGLEECREIPTILAEASRVLAPKGRITIRCLRREKTPWYSYFEKYGFTTAEAKEWLCKVRLFSDVGQIKELLINNDLSLIYQKDDEKLGHIMVFEK